MMIKLRMVSVLSWITGTVLIQTVLCFQPSLLDTHNTRRINYHRHIPGFAPETVHHHTWTSTSGCAVKLCSSDSDCDEILLDDKDDADTDDDVGNNDNRHSNVRVQLWLDLRDTSMPPLTALLHLTDDLWDEYTPPKDKSFIVDRVILDSTQKKNLVKFLSDMKEEFEDEIGLTVVVRNENENEGSIYEFVETDTDTDTNTETEEERMPTPIGKVFEVMKDADSGIVNVDVNPMPILETVLGGRWAILDGSDDGSIDNKSMCSLVGLVSNSVGGVGGGLLSGSSTSAETETDTTTSGGIGIRCNTQAEVVEMGSLFQSMGEKNFQMTESGVLITTPTSSVSSINDEPDTGEDDDQQQTDNNCDESKSVQYALVMPFDSSLWKTASFIFG